MITHVTEGPGGDRAARLSRVLSAVAEEEAAWLLHGDRHHPVYLPWMPFHWADFTAIMALCVAEAEGTAFMDVGAGIATKGLIAAEVFGLAAHAVEHDPEMAAYAAGHERGQVLCADALDLPEAYWGSYDIVWMYRPLRDAARQALLERRVYAGMRPGAILAGGTLEAFPAGWHTVLDDLDAGRGAWKKPAPAPAAVLPLAA